MPRRRHPIETSDGRLLAPETRVGYMARENFVAARRRAAYLKEFEARAGRKPNVKTTFDELEQIPLVFGVPWIVKSMGVSPNSVYRWIKKGELKASNKNKPGMRVEWRIQRDNYLAFLKSRQLEPKLQKKRKRQKADPDVTPFF